MGGTHCDGFSGTLRDAADSGRSWELGAGAEQYPGPCPPQKPAHASNGRDEKTMRTLLCKTRCCPECVCVLTETVMFFSKTDRVL